MRHFALTRADAPAAASKEIKAKMKLNATLCHAHPAILIPIPSQKNATRQRDGQKTEQSTQADSTQRYPVAVLAR